jgi:hypothetical protein
MLEESILLQLVSVALKPEQPGKGRIRTVRFQVLTAANMKFRVFLDVKVKQSLYTPRSRLGGEEL